MSTDMVVQQHSAMAASEATAIAALPPDMALMRMENDHIMAVAQARPRDYSKIKAELFSMIDAFPESAEDAIYNKPVGTVFLVSCECGHRYEVAKLEEQTECPRCANWRPKKWQKQKKFARGLSIRSAENMRVAFGFNRVSTTLTPIDGDRLKITGTFTDYTNGNVTIDEQIVTPFYTSRNKQKTRIPDDRFFNVVLKSEKSKVIREVVLRSVPGTLKAAYEAHCEKAIDGLLDEGTMDKIVGQFSGISVSQEMIENLLGRPRSMGWTKEDRKQLLGIWNAIKDGETTVREVFFDSVDADNSTASPATPPKTTASASVDDLLGSGNPAAPSQPEPAATDSPSTSPDQKRDAMAWYAQQIASSETLKRLNDLEAGVDQDQRLDEESRLDVHQSIEQAREMIRSQRGK
jgi:hypothetical protein